MNAVRDHQMLEKSATHTRNSLKQLTHRLTLQYAPLLIIDFRRKSIDSFSEHEATQRLMMRGHACMHGCSHTPVERPNRRPNGDMARQKAESYSNSPVEAPTCSPLAFSFVSESESFRPLLDYRTQQIKERI